MTAGFLRTTLTFIVVVTSGAIVVGAEVPAGVIPDSHQSKSLSVGDHVRTLVVDEVKRTAIVHVPRKVDPLKPTPVILAIHGVAMSASIMARFCGLNETADEYGFVVVYPNGTGPEFMLTWNAGGFSQGVGSQVDDVKYLDQLLDDIGTVINVDRKRIYATGMSNGGMMCYRLASEMSDRIAAIAPVAGTMAAVDLAPPRPVSVIHFHGTDDTLVPFEMERGRTPFWLRLKSVDATIATWRKFDGCEGKSSVSDVLSKDGDELRVTRQTFGPGDDGAEVVLVTIEGGGHSWPGQVQPFQFLGKSAMNVSANDLIWAFFEKHPMK